MVSILKNQNNEVRVATNETYLNLTNEKQNYRVSSRMK